MHAPYPLRRSQAVPPEGSPGASQRCPHPAEGCPCTRGPQRGKEAARQVGSGPGRGRGPQAPGPPGGPECLGDGKGQAEPEGPQDLQLLDGILARGRQDAQCAPGEQQKDGWRGGPPEGQGEEGGGAGDTRVAAEFVQCDISSKTSNLFVRYTKCLNKEG